MILFKIKHLCNLLSAAGPDEDHHSITENLLGRGWCCTSWLGSSQIQEVVPVSSTPAAPVIQDST